MNIHKPFLTLAGVLIAGFAVSPVVRADFKGGDTLATVIASNWAYSPSGGGTFMNANSRLEFLVPLPGADNSAFLTWKVNQGGLNQNWSVQTDAYLDLFKFPDEGDGTELGLIITPSGESKKFLTISLNRNRGLSASDAGITVMDPVDFVQVQKTNARAAQLRIHYDKVARTLTPSWNIGSGWTYGAPRDLSGWDLQPSETFRVALFARNGVARAASAKVISGQAYFRNFKAGNAAPEILVAKGSVELLDKKGIVLFGAAKANVGKVTKTFRIRNEGTAVLTGLKLSVIGAQADDFTFSNISKRSLAPGDSTTFKIAFRPQSAGVRNAMVFLTSNDADESSFEIRVNGRGVE